MKIKFDLYFTKDLGTLYKDTELDLNGREAVVNIDLVDVNRMQVNYLVNGEVLTGDVPIVDVDENLVIVPFTKQVIPAGTHEMEFVAYMKNGDIKISQTYQYTVDKGLGLGHILDNENAVNIYITKKELDSIISDLISRESLQEFLANFYSKEDVDLLISNIQSTIDFTEYYTKSEILSLTDNFVKTSVLDRYYNKTEVKSLIANFIHTNDLMSYYNKDEIDAKVSKLVDLTTLNNYYTKSDILDLIKNLNPQESYSKQELDNIINNLISKEQMKDYYTRSEVLSLIANSLDVNNITGLDSLLEEYPTLDVVNSLLDKFYTKEDIQILLNELPFDKYYKKDDIDNILNSYVLKSSLEDFYTKSQIDNVINNFSNTHVSIDDLKNYYTKYDIDAKLDELLFSGDIEINLNNYYNKIEIDTKLSDLDFYDKSTVDTKFSELDFYNRTEVDSKLMSYYSSTEVDTKLSEYSTKDDLDSFYTKDNVDEMLDNLDVDLSDYYSKSDVDNMFSDLDIDVDLSDYYSKSEIDDILDDLDVDIDMSDYYNKVQSDELLDSKADNYFEASMPTVSSLGGISAGEDLNGLSIQDILTKLLYPYIHPTISATYTNSPSGSVFELGTEVTITNISTTITKKSKPINRIDFIVNGSVVHSLSEGVQNGGTYTYNPSISIKNSIANTYIRCCVYDGSNTVYANTKALTFCYPYYYGVIEDSVSLDESVILALTKDISSKANKTYTFSPNYQKMVFAYPTSYGKLKSIIDPNGFEIIASFTCESISLTMKDNSKQSYYVYSNSPSTNTNFSVQFKY